MSKIGDLMGRIGNTLARAGVGLPTPPRRADDPRAWRTIVVQDFSSGYDSSSIEEKARPGTSPYLLDLELDSKNRLVPTQGIATFETLDRIPTEMFAHAALDDFVDIVMVSGQYMGIKAGAETIWYDVDLPVGSGWVASLHGEQLLMSNNAPHTDIYARDKQATTVTPLSWGEAATILSFAGRVYAANCNIGGTANPLGIKWTGASGSPTDVAGEGAGFELLLRDSAENDRIIALREIGFDLMAIMLRKSVWVGVPTSVVERPVDFRPRVIGIGAVSERTVRTVQGGVMFLSDNGVALFDGNSVVLKGLPIDSDLLPLDYTNIGAYSATYDSAAQEYILHTPNETWRYSIHFDRWLKSSLVAQSSLALFNPLTQNYEDLDPGWGDSWGSLWSDSPAGGKNALFGDIIYLKDNLLGRPDPNSTSNFGQSLMPTWQSPRVDGMSIEDWAYYDHFDFEFEGAAVANIYIPDANGDLVRLFKTHTLAAALLRRHSKAYATTASGLGLGCKVVFGSTADFKLRRIEVKFRFSSERTLTP